MNSIKYLQHQVFSFEFPILEYKNNNEYIYFCVFSHFDNYYDNLGVLKGYEKGEKASIVRFKFNEHKFDVSLVSVALIDNNKFNDRVITAFIIDELNYIGIIFIKEIDKSNKFIICFYDFSLTRVNNEIEFFNNHNFKIQNLISGNGIYFKAIYLVNYYLAFLYYGNKDDNNSLKFILRKIYVDKDLSKFQDIINKDIVYYLSTDVTLNEFIKYDNQRLVFISNINYDNLAILLFFFSNNFYSMKIRYFSFSLNNYKLSKEMSASFWNDYLLFTSSYYKEYDTKKTIHSLLIIFGFPNGTDFTIDIFPYLMDTGYYSPENNLVTRLLNDLTIDNNIFGFKSTNQIKIIYIPEELLLYNINGNQLHDENIIDKDHILKQNKDIIKTDKLYSFHYQYIVKCSENDLDDMSQYYIDHYSYINTFPDIIYYGRTNYLYFKLCHKFCERCYEY